MNKLDLIKFIMEEHKVSRKKASEYLDNSMGTFVKFMRIHRSLKLKEIGTFELRDHPAKETINPRTREKVLTSPYRKLCFKGIKYKLGE